jgi:probable rRNA maturation factor
MQILIQNRSSELIDQDYCQALAEFVLTQEAARENCELSLSFVNEPEIQDLNREYRGINTPTDVLSFQMDEDDGTPKNDFLAASPDGVRMLGDIIIAPQQAYQHALDFNSTFVAELSLLLVHGVLHLLGYDHIEDAEAEVMEARENQLLELWCAKPANDYQPPAATPGGNQLNEAR